MRQVAVLIAGALLCCASCGSSDGGTSTTASAAKFSDVYVALFPVATKAKCDFCHSQPASEISNGNLHLGAVGDREAVYAALVGKAAVSKACSGALVVPGDAEGSLFYSKITASPTCGERMPLGGGALPAEQIEMIRSWIAAGAKDD